MRAEGPGLLPAKGIALFAQAAHRSTIFPSSRFSAQRANRSSAVAACSTLWMSSANGRKSAAPKSPFGEAPA